MQMFRPQALHPHRPKQPNPAWCASIFDARSAVSGGVVRRSVRDVEREIGREMLEYEVRRRGFHLIECGGQFIIICNPGLIKVIC